MLFVAGALLAESGCSTRQALQTDSTTERASSEQVTDGVVPSKKDFQRLVDLLVPFSKQMLEKSGEFYPFAAAIDTSGKPSLFSADSGEGEQPESAELLALLIRGLDKGRVDGHLRATGVCFSVTTTLPDSKKKTDAIKLALRRTDGSDRDVLVPYQKKKGERIEYGRMLFLVPADSTNPSSTGTAVSGLD